MKNQTLRVIAGKYKGRKLSFPKNIANLRPTPDRIRETLFNWLQATINGARCLDCFSGSGALGIEAISRDASDCVFIEQDRVAYRAIKQILATLNCNNQKIFNMDIYKYFQLAYKNNYKFDLIFLDPPFGKNMLKASLAAIIGKNLLSDNGLVYFECEAKSNIQFVNDNWEIIKKGQAGDVVFGLFKNT